MLLFCIAALHCRCSLIDDDLTNCGYSYKMMYSLQLATGLQLELDEALNEEADQPIKQAVLRYLSPVFTDNAHDVDLSFFVQSEDKRTCYLNEVINSNRSSLSFYLPVDDYVHLAVANIKDNSLMNICDSTSSATMRLSLDGGDRIGVQRTGVFTARRPILLQDTVGNQELDVILYMANCAAVLVLDTTGESIKDLQVEVRGTADEFMLNDSVYGFSRKVVVEAENVINHTGREMPRHLPTAINDTLNHRVGYAAVCLPSSDMPDDNGNYWTMAVYATLDDGSVTETLLDFKTPLPASHAKVIKAEMQGKGEIVPIGAPEVGATVTLQWKSGGEHDVEL